MMKGERYSEVIILDKEKQPKKGSTDSNLTMLSGI
jgi:hypothetical protein